jgi:hypothetical protein
MGPSVHVSSIEAAIALSATAMSTAAASDWLPVQLFLFDIFPRIASERGPALLRTKVERGALVAPCCRCMLSLHWHSAYRVNPRFHINLFLVCPAASLTIASTTPATAISRGAMALSLA